MLNDKELLRYSRQIMLEDVQQAGQQRLKQAHVLVIGAGGLGSSVLLYLAAAGVGQLTVFDDDVVSLSNLQRQILYKVNHVHQPKAQAAAKTLRSLNNQITVETHAERFNEHHIKYLDAVDCVLDCSDNFSTRNLLNRVCQQSKVPLISGSATGFSGQVFSADFSRALLTRQACYACVYGEPQSHGQNCDTLGVIAPLLGVVGSLQGQLAINYLLHSQLPNQLLTYDAKTISMRTFKLAPSEQCHVCGGHKKSA